MRQILAVAAVAGLLSVGCATTEEAPLSQTAAATETFETPETDLRPTDPEPQPSAGDTAEASELNAEPAGPEPVDTDPGYTTGDSSEPADVGTPDDSTVEPGDGSTTDGTPDNSTVEPGDGSTTDGTPDNSTVEPGDGSTTDGTPDNSTVEPGDGSTTDGTGAAAVAAAAEESEFGDPYQVELPEAEDLSATVAWLTGGGAAAVGLVTHTAGLWAGDEPDCGAVVAGLDQLGSPAELRDAALATPDPVTADLLEAVLAGVVVMLGSCDHRRPDSAEHAWQWTMAHRRLVELGVIGAGGGPEPA